MLSCYQGIESDQSYRIALNRVIDERRLRRRHVRLIGKNFAQSLAPVMIAGNQEKRRNEPGQDLPQDLVLFFTAMVGQIARCDHHVGPWFKTVDVRDSLRKLRIGRDLPVTQTIPSDDVEIGDLRDDHGLMPSAIIRNLLAAGAPPTREGRAP